MSCVVLIRGPEVLPTIVDISTWTCIEAIYKSGIPIVALKFVECQVFDRKIRSLISATRSFQFTSMDFLRPSRRALIAHCRALDRTGRGIATNNRFLKVSPDVQDAIKAKKAVVALESTIYTHGFPYPENIALASRLESIVRLNGATPATIGVLDGVARVGMAPEDIIRLVSGAGHEDTIKVSRRDLGYICGLVLMMLQRY